VATADDPLAPKSGEVLKGKSRHGKGKGIGKEAGIEFRSKAEHDAANSIGTLADAAARIGLKARHAYKRLMTKKTSVISDDDLMQAMELPADKRIKNSEQLRTLFIEMFHSTQDAVNTHPGDPFEWDAESECYALKDNWKESFPKFDTIFNSLPVERRAAIFGHRTVVLPIDDPRLFQVSYKREAKTDLRHSSGNFPEYPAPKRARGHHSRSRSPRSEAHHRHGSHHASRAEARGHHSRSRSPRSEAHHRHGSHHASRAEARGHHSRSRSPRSEVHRGHGSHHASRAEARGHHSCSRSPTSFGHHEGKYGYPVMIDHEDEY
jgi:hypothetical protein